MPQWVILSFQLAGVVFVALLLPIAGVVGGVHVYRQGHNDAMALLEARDRKPVPPPAAAAPTQVQTAATVTVQASPYESVCRTHNGVKGVSSYLGSVTVSCHDGFFEMRQP